MNRDKEWFLKSLEGITLTDDYGNEFNGGYEEGLNTAYELALQLDEQGITQEQAWEVIAPRFSMEPKQLEESVVHGFIAMTAEEIEMESYKIKQLADRVKKLHAENEELKAKIDEPEVVVIPKFVADYLEKANKEISLLRVFEIANGLSELDMWRKEYNWVRLYHLDFARAWLDGYEIEKEKLYYVVDEKGQTLLFKSQARGIIRSNGADLGKVLMVREGKFSDMYQLTEKEIKDCDERYWAFAVPVEETL